MSKKANKVSLYHYEILDRCHVINELIHESLITHPAMTKTQRRKLEKAQGWIGEVYQWAGSKSH